MAAAKRRTLDAPRANPVRRSGRRWGAVVAALAAILLATAGPAWAEIIDFDPAIDDVPEILDADDMDRYELLTSAGFTWMQSTPNPAGTRVLAYTPAGQGFLDLDTGALTRLLGGPADEPPPGQAISGYVWTSDMTLATLNREEVRDEMGELTAVHHYRVDYDATTGAFKATEVDVQTNGKVVGVSPDLMSLVVMEFPGGNPPLAKTVTIGPRYGGPAPELPPGVDSLDELPGAIDRDPSRTLEVQQAGFNLVLQSLDGTTRHALTAVPAETSLTGVMWSPDGARFAVGLSTMPDWDGDRQRDNVPPAGGLPNLGSVNVQEALGKLAPEANPLVTGTRLQVFTAAGAEVKVFNNIDFKDRGQLAQIAFSPTGKRALLVILQRTPLKDRQYPTYAFPRGVELHLLDADFNVVRQLQVPGADSLSLGGNWVDDDHFLFSVPSELDTRLVAYDLTTDQTSVLWDKPGALYQTLPTAKGLVFSHTTVDNPLELWVSGSNGAVTGNPARELTYFNRDVRFASNVKWADVTWTSGGATLHGIFVYPETMTFPPARPGPVVVWQQGGPGGQMTNDFGGSVESPYTLLPNFGIPAFMANAAGRSVQTTQFFADMADGRNFGQLDIQQIKDGVDHLVRQGIVDAKRVGLTGCSYGGYFTFQSLRSFPGFYAAGNPQCSLVDLTEEFTFGYTPFISYLMGRAPMADPAEYLKDSPMYGTKDMRTPALIFHGTKDFLPVPLINNIHDQIDANGVDVTFFRAKGYPHGLGSATDDNGDYILGSEVTGQAYAFQLQLEFFREYLDVAKVDVSNRPSTVFMPALNNGSAPELR